MMVVSVGEDMACRIRGELWVSGGQDRGEGEEERGRGELRSKARNEEAGDPALLCLPPTTFLSSGPAQHGRHVPQAPQIPAFAALAPDTRSVLPSPVPSALEPPLSASSAHFFALFLHSTWSTHQCWSS